MLWLWSSTGRMMRVVAGIFASWGCLFFINHRTGVIAFLECLKNFTQVRFTCLRAPCFSGFLLVPRRASCPESHARETSGCASGQFVVLNPSCSQVFARFCEMAPLSHGVQLCPADRSLGTSMANFLCYFIPGSSWSSTLFVTPFHYFLLCSVCHKSQAFLNCYIYKLSPVLQGQNVLSKYLMRIKIPWALTDNCSIPLCSDYALKDTCTIMLFSSNTIMTDSLVFRLCNHLQFAVKSRGSALTQYIWKWGFQ